MPESKNRRKKPARRPGGSGRPSPAAAPPVDAELARLAAEGLPGGSTAFDPEATANAVALGGQRGASSIARRIQRTSSCISSRYRGLRAGPAARH